MIGSPGSRIVKIGYSKTPEKRLWSIQVGSPVRLSLLAVFPGDRDLERALHRYFHAQNKHGEWFELGFRPAEEVRAAVALLGDGRAATAAYHPKTPQLGQVRSLEWDARFPALFDGKRAGFGIARTTTGFKTPTEACPDLAVGCPDAEAFPSEPGWEARSWTARFPVASASGGADSD